LEIRDFTGNLQHTTTRLIATNEKITTHKKNGEVLEKTMQSKGTGFFFDFGIAEIGQYLKVIVTNRHVVENAIELDFVMNERDASGHRSDTQHPLYIGEEDLNRYVFYHPDPNVDLCIIDISEIVNYYSNQGKPLFMRPLSFEEIPSREELQELKALEEVVMIGYPAGLWDEYNNLPIMRTGDTSSHIAYDYQGREDFMVNIPAYHGSSGSPLIKLVDEHIVEDGENFIQHSCLLLGIQKEIPLVRNMDGSIYTNLGVFIKSYRLYDFLPLVRAAYQEEINEILRSRQ